MPYKKGQTVIAGVPLKKTGASTYSGEKSSSPHKATGDGTTAFDMPKGGQPHFDMGGGNPHKKGKSGGKMPSRGY